MVEGERRRALWGRWWVELVGGVAVRVRGMADKQRRHVCVGGVLTNTGIYGGL
jgi:hypothetical protein